MMCNCEYGKKVMATLVGAAVAIPSIAFGFYVTYQVVTALGN